VKKFLQSGCFFGKWSEVKRSEVKLYSTKVSKEHGASTFRVEMEAAGSLKMLLPIYHTVRCHTSKYSNLQSHFPKTFNLIWSPLPLRDSHTSSHPATRNLLNPAHTTAFNFCKIDFNIILPPLFLWNYWIKCSLLFLAYVTTLSVTTTAWRWITECY